MSFPLGKPILFMIAAAVVSGAIVSMRRPAAPADITIWTFTSARSFLNRASTQPSIMDAYRSRTGQSVRVKLISARALDTRLLSIFRGTGRDAEIPDLVEVEIGSVGKFFRPPVSEIGFLPLDEYLDKSGLRARFLPSRLAPWSKGGHVLGLPQDVHPVSLTYRKDLFDLAGVDPSAAQTWPELQEACLKFEGYWHSHGAPQRRAMELPTNSADYLYVMLLQRHLNLLDANDGIHLADPKVASTVAFYAGLVAGPRAIAGDSAPGETLWAGDVSRGDLCMLFTPDWRAGSLKRLAPELAGKLAMMALPRFDPDDSPTGTWGGTMMAIPRRCPNPDRAWALVVFLSTSREAMQAAHDAGLDLIPPLPERWSDPIYHAADPFYFGSQSINDLYIRLARELPPRYVTPFTDVATTELSDVLSRAVAQMRESGDRDLEAKCQSRLNEAAKDLQRRISFGTFED